MPDAMTPDPENGRLGRVERVARPTVVLEETVKRAILLLVSTAVLGAGVAFGQTVLSQKSHGASVTVPNMAFIRMTLGASNADVAAPDQVDFTMTPLTYQIGTFSPTNGGFNWDDVKVFYNTDAAWEVVVSTSGDTAAPATSVFDWTKVSMTPTVVGVGAYTLGATTTIYTDTVRTTGWMSLGIDPADYLVTFDGLEDPGVFTTLVTFTLQNP